MSVIERPDEYSVRRPLGEHATLEPFRAFETDDDGAALVVLNTPLQRVPVKRLWKGSSLHVCADGGANRLHDCFLDAERAQFVPTFIVGDLDSLRADVRRYYELKGTVVIPQYSEYSSDLMKALKVVMLDRGAGRDLLRGPVPEEDGLSELLAQYPADPDYTVYLAGGIGGRFDQTFQLVNQLYALHAAYPGLRLFFFLPSDVVFLLGKGTSYVRYANRRVFNTADPVPKCGLLPFRASPVLNTWGFRYDVVDWVSRVGGNVSSSNAVVGVDGFVVRTTESIVMNVEVSIE